jgi:Polysaccharide lyase
MDDTTIPAGKGENQSLSLIAFFLFLAGFALPILCWAFWLPKPLLFGACGAEVLALVLGAKAWRRWLGRIAVFGAVAFGLLGLWLGQTGFPTYPLKVKPTADWMKPLNANWITQSAAKPYSVQTDADMKRNGSDSLRFELRGDDRWVDQTFMRSFRSEVSTKEFPPINSVRWYAFSVYFPTDFPIEDNRLVFAQWHQIVWDAFGGPAPSPSLSFHFTKGKFFISSRHFANRVVREDDDVPKKRLFEKNKFRLSRWHDFVVQVKWSWQDDGFVNVWWNNQQIVEYRGPVGYNQDIGPEFKFGLYRDATNKTYVAYFNHVKSGDSPQDVDFDPSTANRYSPD